MYYSKNLVSIVIKYFLKLHWLYYDNISTNPLSGLNVNNYSSADANTLFENI